MTGEEPSIPVIVERIKNVQEDVTEIKLNMATRNDQAHVDERIANIVGALATERTERVAAVEAEKAERVSADRDEAEARRKLADRLQVVEDRMEARKYNVGIAIVLSAVTALFGLVGTLAATGILGG